MVEAVKAAREDSYSPATQSVLKDLCLTDRTLCSIARPVLFDHFTLFEHPAESLVRARKLLSLLDSQVESRGWIKRLELHWLPWRRDPFGDPETIDHPEQLLRTVSQLFVRLTQLSDLSVISSKFTEEMYAHLYQLPSLHTVRFQSVPMDSCPLDTAELDVQKLRIRDLNISYDIEDGTGVTATARLAQSPSLRSLTTGKLTDEFLESLIGRPPRTFDNVEDLDVSGYEMELDRVVTLTLACPNIKSLNHAGSGTSAVTLPSGSIPRLNKIEGPLDGARMLVPGRPVRSIIVVSEEEVYECSREILEPLGAGSVRVKELTIQSIRWMHNAMDIIFDIVPEVEELKLQFVGKDQVIHRRRVDRMAFEVDLSLAVLARRTPGRSSWALQEPVRPRARNAAPRGTGR